MIKTQSKPMKKKAKPRAKTKAPVRWSQALADRICERLKGGESLNEICKNKGYPSEAAVREWARDDKNGFTSSYARARELGYCRLAEEILRIADTPVIGEKRTTKPVTTKNSDGNTVDTGLLLEEVTQGDMIDHRRLQIDTRKWMLSKMLPKIYGDKQQLELSGSVDIAGTLQAARKRSGLA